VEIAALRVDLPSATGSVRRHARTETPQHWTTAARLYGEALASGAIPGVAAAAPESGTATPGELRVVPIVVHDLYAQPLNDLLAAAYRDLAAGEIVIVDVPGRIPNARSTGLDRDTLASALFAAGFDCPFVAAGHQALAAERVHKSPIDLFLTPCARGATPSHFPGLDTTLEPPPDRLIAFARRGSLAPPRERTLLLSVIMPVYNEHSSFCDVMERLLAKHIPGFDIEICLVESNSTDGTREDALRYAHHPRVRLLLEDKPSGKGHAVRKGLDIATGDVVLIQDADLEYDLADYEKLLDPIQRLEASFVLGSRHPAGEHAWQIRQFSSQRGVSEVMNLGHLFFTWFFNTMFSQRLRDPFTMFKVFRRDCIHNVRFECDRFDFDHELVGKLIRKGFSPMEINVHYQSRSFDDGKKVAFFRDPPTWIKACLKHRFSDLYIWPASE
jgi:hypothetical protein